MYDAGLLHPPPRPHGIPPLPVKWVVVLFALAASPSSWVVLFGLVPSPPVEWGLWSFWLAFSARGGQCVLQRYGMVAAACQRSCHRYALVTIHNMMLLFSPCKRCPCPCSDAVLRSVKKHWLGSFSVVLPPTGFCGFVPGTTASRGGPGAGSRGRGGWGTIGGGGGGPREHTYIYIYVCIYIYTYIYIYIYSYSLIDPL